MSEMKIILASTSPNRRELFDRMGIHYEAIAPDYEEIIDHSIEPYAQVEAFALGKGASVDDQLNFSEDYLVMGFDSMIEFEGTSLGKAKNKEEAMRMLKSFIGKPQNIVSGFALIGSYQGKKFNLTDHQATSVKFRSDVTEAEIEKYLKFGDWAGKCGAYSILGPGIFFLESLDGDFQNIVGVPVMRIGKHLKKITGHSLIELSTPKA